MSDPGLADFVLAHGTEALGAADGAASAQASVPEMEALLARCAARTDRRVPLIVANPDLVTVDGKELRVMPGSLARYYQQLGGEARASHMLET